MGIQKKQPQRTVRKKKAAPPEEQERKPEEPVVLSEGCFSRYIDTEDKNSEWWDGVDED